MRDLLFGAATASVVGPVQQADVFVLMRVFAIVPAVLDAATRDAIKKILFDQWLEERRKSASIEWFWGNARQTLQSARSRLVDVA